MCILSSFFPPTHVHVFFSGVSSVGESFVDIAEEEAHPENDGRDVESVGGPGKRDRRRRRQRTCHLTVLIRQLFRVLDAREKGIAAEKGKGMRREAGGWYGGSRW